jgi:LacI family transcriptional regulator
MVRPVTRARVEQAARDLHYRPDFVARGLRSGKTNTVGVIVASLSNPFIAPVLLGMTEVLEEAEFVPVIAETRDDSARLRRLVDLLLGRRVDGLIIAAARSEDRPLLTSLSRQGIPVMLAARSLLGSKLPAVTFDGKRGGELVAEHLVSLEHEVLAQIEGPQDIASFVERGDGFRGAAARLNATLIAIPTTAAPTIEEGQRMMAELLALPERPTAVFAHNDLLAVGAIDAIGAAGLSCPEDISVVGHDDSPLVQRMRPPLTTVATPGYQLGRLAGATLLGMLRDPETEAASIALGPTLVIRGSTALRSHEADW